MGLDFKDWASIVFVLILVYLLVNNGQNTSTVINSLSSGAGSLIKDLQGRQ